MSHPQLSPLSVANAPNDDRTVMDEDTDRLRNRHLLHDDLEETTELDADSFDQDGPDGERQMKFEWSKSYFAYRARRLWRPIQNYAHSLWIGEQLALKYLYADSKRHMKGLFIGIFTVFLVVVLVAVLENNLLRAPIIFWRVAETSVGENDLVLTNGFGVAGIQSIQGESGANGITNVLVQQAYIASKLQDVGAVQGTTGRWLLFGRILQNTNATVAPTATDNTTTTSTTVRHSAAAYILGIDSLIESEIGLGRSWDYPPLANDELYLSRSIVREIGLDPDTAVDTTVILRFDLLDVAQTLNIGGIGGDSASGGSDTFNTSTKHHSQSDSAQAAEEAKEDNNTPEQNQALILRLLIERAAPNVTQLWDQPINWGNNTDLVMALVDYVNDTVSAMPAWDGVGYESFPIIAKWQPGQPIPPSIQPLLDVLGSRYHIYLTPTQLETLLQQFLSSAQIAPATGWVNSTASGDAMDQTFSYDTFIFDPATIQQHLTDLKNGTETYGQLLDLFTPFITQMLRIDTVFIVKGVVDKPDGKWAESLGSVIVMESKTLMNLLSGSIEKILYLQNQVNMSAPIPTINSTGFPNVPTTPPSYLTATPSISTSSTIFPLEALIEAFAPRVNASVLHNVLNNLDSVARALQNNTRALLSVVEYSDRLTVYLKDLDSMNADLIVFTNYVSQELGFDFPLTYTLPLALTMKVTIYIRYFLDNIFGSVLALLCLLGMLLIYSLLLNDVDTKTYEYGMLRALGMKHTTLIQLLVSKSGVFSIVGISIGLFVAFLVNIPLAFKLANFANVAPQFWFYPSPIIVAVILGLLMPLLANVIPISRALSKTLRDSLDVYHVVLSEVTIRMIKLSELGIDLWQTCISVLLIVVGFTTFYIVPYAFTFGQIPLFLGILNAILLGMLLGLCILADLFQSSLEKIVLRLMMYVIWPHRKLYNMITKNLSAHRGRNKKTSQMFLICLAFLIFAGVMFALQSRSLGDNLKVFIGSDILIYSPVKDATQHLREDQMRTYLNSISASTSATGVVDSYSFVTYPLNYLLPVSNVAVSSLARYPSFRNSIFGLEANFLDVAYDEFLSIGEINAATSDSATKTRSGRVDVVKLLFQPDDSTGSDTSSITVPNDLSSGTSYAMNIGNLVNDTETAAEISASYHSSLRVLTSEALRGGGSIGLTTPLLLSIDAWNDNYEFGVHYQCHSVAMIIKLPGFFFSSYRQTSWTLSNLLLSMDQYHEVMNVTYGSYALPKDPPKQKLLIRLTPNATPEQCEDVINGLRTFFKNDKTQVMNTGRLIGTMAQAIDLMNLFFQLVGAIAMTMCFFILWLSFTANVEENAWEFGVLRAIGLNSVEVVMIYVYESLALVLASVILGTGIGLLIAATLTLQFNLFTELPFHMEFPTPLFMTMLTMAFTVAIVGSGLPAYRFLNKTISSVLRRQ